MAINGKWVYEDLTWAEMNQAVEAGLIPVLPVGTMEQHGPHLPVKMETAGLQPKWPAPPASSMPIGFCSCPRSHMATRRT